EMRKLSLVLALAGLGLLVAGVWARDKRDKNEDTVSARQKDEEAAHKPVLVRVPNHGIQPQVAVDSKGVVHLLYFKGEPGGGDLFYTTSKDGVHFKHAIRVNSQPGSAVATGNIRGGHLAVGKGGRAHV